MLKPAVKRGRKQAPVTREGVWPVIAVTIALAILSASAVAWFQHRGYTLYYGDAEAHLNIARRIVDSRTPGYDQIGTVWLPLPHALMLPFVRDDALWRTGLAGAIPVAMCFVLAGGFLFAAARRVFHGAVAATVAVTVFALNPNLLYLQSTPMTEVVFFGALLAMLYFTVLFSDTKSEWAAAGAGLAAMAGTLTRYEGWFLLPFAAGYIFFAGGRRVRPAAIFSAIAAAGPLYWLAHNWYYFGSPLEFYNGQYSAKAIYQRALDAGMARYRGDHNLADAWLYFRSAAQLCAGTPLVWLGAAGVLAAIVKRAFWPLIFLALPPIFYVWSMYSSGTPIFVPQLWPHSYYNTRYGLAAMPLLALLAGALVALVPGGFRAVAGGILVLAAVSPWIMYPRAESWICWKESQVNSEARRAWTREVAGFLRAHYRGGGIATSFGDLAGVYREAGIPLRETLHDGNEPQWMAATQRPDLFLWEEWAVGTSDDRISAAVLKMERTRGLYECVKIVATKDAPVLQIYHRRYAALRQ